MRGIGRTAAHYLSPNAALLALLAATAIFGGCDDFDLFTALDGEGLVSLTRPLAIRPTETMLYVSGSYTFSASGGTPPYSFSVVEGSGRMDAASGSYTAPPAPGIETLRVTDAASRTDDARVTVLGLASFVLSPASVTLGANSSITFVASGGTSPYLYAVSSGSGAIDGQSGLYTAPACASHDTVRATDAAGDSAEAVVTVLSALEFTISPVAITLYVNTTVDFDAFGGTTPYVFSLASGSGSVDATTGIYRAPSSSGADVVRVTDATGARSDAAITVYFLFAISPSNLWLTVGSTFPFTATGGLEPYVFSMKSGSGTVDGTTGLYTAPGTPDYDVVMAQDALGNTSRAAVVAALPAPLAISPPSVILNINATVLFGATGGQAPYTYSVENGGAGDIGAATGVYTAPGAPEAGTAVRVTDGLGVTNDASVTVVGAGPLTIYPSSGTVSQTQPLVFSASGGTPPYAYSVAAGGGTVSASTGVYTAPMAIGSATVRVTDSLAASAEAAVDIAPLPPANLVADGGAGGPTLIRLTWLDQATGEEGFSIERRLSATTFAEIASLGPDATGYDDSGLTASKVYIYRVRAFAASVFSPYSGEAFATPNQ